MKKGRVLTGVYAAFMCAAGAILSANKGGGGDYNCRRVSGRFAAARAVKYAAGVVFALCAWAASIPAAAQTACDGMATFNTYVPSSGTWTDPTVGAGRVDDFDLNGSLADAFVGRTRGALDNASVSLLDESGVFVNNFDDTFDSNGEPLFTNRSGFGQRIPNPGERIRFQSPIAVPPNRRIFRVYRRASDNMLGLTQLTPTETATCADGLTGDQFFLDEDWAETKTANANNQGHTAPDCASANRMAGDLMCGGCLANFAENSAGMCEMVPTCGVDMRLDAAANECVACDAGMVSGADEQTCRMPMSDAECMRVDANLPIWDGSSCVAAPPSCGVDMQLDADANECVACEAGMVSGMDEQTCRAPANSDECARANAATPMWNGSMCVADETPPPPAPAPQPTPAPAPQTSQGVEDADWATAGGIVGGIMGLVFAVHYLGGEADAFSFNPDFGYSISESGYSYKYGGRLDLIKDAWSLYMSAGQRNADGDWGDLRYESGGEYDGGFWKAAFSESIAGETTDYDFSLSADWTGGIWRLSPTYRFRSQLTQGGLESESKNALNLEAALEYNRWTVRPSAGFRWRRADDFGDNAKFGITAVRRF